MTGCYAEKKGGQAEIKLTRNGTAYNVQVLMNGKWESDSLRKAQLSELVPIFGKDTSQIAEALVAVHAPFGFFRTRTPTASPGAKDSTEYLVFLLLAAAPAYKVSCGK